MAQNDEILKTQIVGVLWKIAYLGNNPNKVDDSIIDNSADDIASFISDYEDRKETH